jgi:hypothetical protein
VIGPVRLVGVCGCKRSIRATITALWRCFGPALKYRSLRVHQVAVNGAAGSDALRRNIRLVLDSMDLQKVYTKRAELGLRYKVLKMTEKRGTMGVEVCMAHVDNTACASNNGKVNNEIR